MPKEAHSCFGNLDVNTTNVYVKEYVADLCIFVLSSEIVRSKKIAQPRSVVAQVTIDQRDKKKLPLPIFGRQIQLSDIGVNALSHMMIGLWNRHGMSKYFVRAICLLTFHGFT